MDHDPRIGKRKPLALGSSGQQDSSHRCGLADAIRGHVAGDKLHRVVDGHPGADATTRTVDVHMDICLGIVRLQEQHLGDQCVGDLIVDIGPQEDDAVFE